MEQAKTPQQTEHTTRDQRVKYHLVPSYTCRHLRSMGHGSPNFSEDRLFCFPSHPAQSILAKLVFRDGFAELKALLQATGKGEQNVWYWANKARSDGWTRIDLYQKEQRDYQS